MKIFPLLALGIPIVVLLLVLIPVWQRLALYVRLLD